MEDVEELLGDGVELILIFQQGSHYPDRSEALVANSVPTP